MAQEDKPDRNEKVKTEELLTIGVSPHIRDTDTTARIMGWVIIALLPITFYSIYIGGLSTLVVIVMSVAGAVATEAVIQRLRHMPVTIGDLSALLTGLLLALTLPPRIPFWMPLVGGAVAIALGKQVFGGLGHNIFNPALVGRAFLAAAFPLTMTTWIPPAMMTVDTATFATPLGGLKFQEAVVHGMLVPLRDLLWGKTGGSLGETSAIFLLLGGVYLLSRRTIDWRIPAGIIAALVVFTGVFWVAAPGRYASPLFHVLSGGLLLGSFFMATDMVTSPVTRRATWIYALGIGLVVGLIRLFGGYPEGVMYAILFMNAFVPLLEAFLRPRIFGEKKKRTR